ncbi:hypothetical protein Tco_1185905 [Tanacetum coccineum]
MSDMTIRIMTGVKISIGNPMMFGIRTPGSVLGIKPKGKLRIPICLGDVRGTSGSDAFHVVSPVIGVRNPMLCLQRRLVVSVDLGQMLLDTLLHFWPKGPMQIRTGMLGNLLASVVGGGVGVDTRGGGVKVCND